VRFMVLVRADERSETGMVLVPEGYTEELVRAGVLLAADVLIPSGVRVRFRADRSTTVVEGPFGDPLVAGYWLLDVGSREEAVEWARRCPFAGPAEVEICQVAPER
jgi:hypothetical protein